MIEITREIRGACDFELGRPRETPLRYEISWPDAGFCLGVQWHPENFWRSGTFATLFEGFVGAARLNKLRRA